MPTLEERQAESPAQLKKRLKARTKDFGINCAFAEYMEMMEKYLLTLERRVKRLERHHDYDSEDLLNMDGEEIE
ncbi:MAG: hypothetical protein HQK62_06625 [Desulfamplus sp.]|nr:hypothetical protein [Desulfamplus sp.]MBF0258501.1 hypothetical protein [Desulfamplus sp.]